MVGNSIKSFLIFLAFLLTGTLAVNGQAISRHSMTQNGRLMLGLHGHDTTSTAYHDFTQQFLGELSKAESFFNAFDSLDCVSFLYPPDSSFRLMSWQAEVDKDKFSYSACLQTKDTLYVFKENTRYFTHASFNTLELAGGNWYGCLYYGIKHFVNHKQDMYVLFGFQQPGPFTSRKIMDVLWFRDGKPVFGNPVFCNRKKDECISRMVLDYSSNATIRLNYDKEYKLIIFDHLIKGANPDMYGQSINMTDGSYDAYKLRKNGTWEFIDMLWHDKQKEPPTDKPKTEESRKKDILGR